MSRSAHLCATCGGPVDALRARQVTVGDGGFAYHCCSSSDARRSVVSEPPPDALLSASPVEDEDEPPRDQEGELRRAIPEEAEEPPLEGAPPPLLLGIAITAAALGLVLLLPTASPVLSVARVISLTIATVGYGVHALAFRRRTGATFLSVGSAAIVTLLAIASRIRGAAGADDVTTLGGFVCLAAAVLTLLLEWVTRRTEARRAALLAALSSAGRRVGRGDVTVVAPHELRPGELVEVRTGERVPADLEVSTGRGRVLPYPGARAPIDVGPGRFLLGGARVLAGTVTGRVAHAGADRLLARLVHCPGSRVDESTPAAEWSAIASVHGALGAGGLMAIAAYLSRGQPSLADAAVAVAATVGAFSAPLGREIAGIYLARAVLEAGRLGAVYRDLHAFQAAARVTTAVFSARSTLMVGHPEVVEVEGVAGASGDEVLSLAASALVFRDGAAREALLKTARRKNVPRDRARGATHARGLGVRATTPDGEPLLVGTRALLLDARVPLALHEARVAALEAAGRSVLLVAVAGRLLGFVALQDALAEGARAAVHHLTRAGVEPVLLSGEARDTVDVLAGALGIDHVRPELLPEERAQQIDRLVDAGAIVAALGHQEEDDDVLARAHVSVVAPLERGGALPSIAVASDRIESAAIALTLPGIETSQLRVGAFLALGPPFVALLGVLFGLAPLVLLPLAGVLGGLGAAIHAKATEPPDHRTSPWELAAPRRRGLALSDEDAR